MTKVGEYAHMGELNTFKVTEIFRNALSFGARGKGGTSKGRASVSISDKLMPDLCLKAGAHVSYRMQPGEGRDIWCIIDPDGLSRGRRRPKVLVQGNRAVLELQGYHFAPFKRTKRDIEMLASGEFRFLVPPGLKTSNGVTVTKPIKKAKRNDVVNEQLQKAFDAPRPSVGMRLSDAERGEVFDKLHAEFGRLIGWEPKTKREKHDIKKYFEHVGRRQRKALYGGLDLHILQEEAWARSNAPRGYDHAPNSWSVAEWGNAVAGECGEACNVAKKLLRLRKGTRGNTKKGDKTETSLKEKLASEMAGVINYVVVWAASEGIDISVACVEEFNRKSREIGYDFQL